MKYCKNCGMLLEDTHMNCIRCGRDVRDPKDYSLYPPEVEKKLESENQKTKKRGGIIAAIVVVMLLLAAIVAAILIRISSGQFAPAPVVGQDEPTKEAVTEVPETVEEEPIEDDSFSPELEINEEVSEEPVEPRAERGPIKDNIGHYFIVQNIFDDAGNVVFTAVYPEDLTVTDYSISYDINSTRYAQQISFVATDAENTVRFTYMSPQQLWYKDSETGKTRKNERDIQYYMSYLTYTDAKDYLELLLEQSYKSAKKIELLKEEDISPEKVAALSDFSSERTKALSGSIGDYAHIATDTVYAAMEATYSAKVYEYEITTAKKELLYCKFFVPVLANNLYYSSDSGNDRGTVTEWFIPCVASLECGNVDFYDQYVEAFDVFLANCVPSDVFFYTNNAYGQASEEAIKDEEERPAYTKDLLDAYSKKFATDKEIGDFNKSMKTFLTASSKVMNNNEVSVYVPSTVEVGFYDSVNHKLFVSSDMTEDPGTAYDILDGSVIE